MIGVLTLALVRERVEHILAMDASGGDPESAHGSQDDLYVDVLRAVATGLKDAQEMARETLRVAASSGVRWYA